MSLVQPTVPAIAMRRVRRVHFIGIGGVGMSGIAEVLQTLGYSVSGSDIVDSPTVRHLKGLGVRIELGHRAENLQDVDVVVTSTAVRADNPELATALTRRIPVVRRAEMLAELMRFRQGIAVAGTHGKTTTTSLIAALLAEGGMDPTYVIGGKLLSSSTHARLGTGQYLVAEADESDASFLHLQPHIAVVTNIDADHMETYGGDFDRLVDAFVEFLHNLPFYGLAVLCAEDANLMGILPRIGRQVLTYGIGVPADVRADDLQSDGFGSRFAVVLPDDTRFEARLAMPGRHNVLNALAAITVAHDLGVDAQAMQRALGDFQGIGRRLERHGLLRHPRGEALLVDDYGHHPCEVAATLSAVRAAWPERRMVVVFQPHRYSRTRDLFEDFVRELSEADVLVLLEVYPAGEEPVAGADSRVLARAIRARGQVDPVYAADSDEVVSVLGGLLADKDVLLTLGAGNVGGLPARLQAAPWAGGGES
ncbi:MAG: UDP-N-acetylmuramate--L-alanine ligase [Halothiobacillaceae bacterium]